MTMTSVAVLCGKDSSLLFEEENTTKNAFINVCGLAKFVNGVYALNAGTGKRTFVN